MIEIISLTKYNFFIILVSLCRGPVSVLLGLCRALGRSCSNKPILLRIFDDDDDTGFNNKKISPRSSSKPGSPLGPYPKGSMSNFYNIVPETLIPSLPPQPENALELPAKAGGVTSGWSGSNSNNFVVSQGPSLKVVLFHKPGSTLSSCTASIKSPPISPTIIVPLQQLQVSCN